MSAQIIVFPDRVIDRGCLALVGWALVGTMPITSSDAELDLLIQIGGKLLDKLNDDMAIDCWLAMLDRRETQNAG